MQMMEEPPEVKLPALVRQMEVDVIRSRARYAADRMSASFSTPFSRLCTHYSCILLVNVCRHFFSCSIGALQRWWCVELRTSQPSQQ
jgi:hypothetical protein